MVQRFGLTAALTLSLLGLGTAAHAAPNPFHGSVGMVGCTVGGDTVTFRVLHRGSVGFVLDESGEPTGEKLFFVVFDSAVFSGGTLQEFDKVYGNRTGQGDRLFCTGTVDFEGDAIGFYDAVVIRS